MFLGPLLLVLAFHSVRRILLELLDGGPLRPTPAITEARGGAEYIDAEAGAENDTNEGDES